MTLTDFLLARIAEDEAAVEIRAGVSVDYWTDAEQAACERVGRWRVLAECEAKRRIVEWVVGSQAAAGEPPGFDPADAARLTLILRVLALPYADHEDFREEWKV